MKSKFIFFFFLSVVCINKIFCSSDTTEMRQTKPSIIGILGEDIKTGLDDALGLIGTPLSFSKSDWILTASGIAMSALIMTTDREVKRIVARDKRRIFDGEYQSIPIKYGQIEYGAIFAAGTYGLGLFAGWDDLRITGRLLSQGLLYSGSAIMILRWAFGRTRPFLTDNAWDFKWFVPRFRSQSFPSGHAAVSLTLSTILSNRINNIFATVGLYGLSILDVFLQVYNNQHWLSDIVIGSAIGTGISIYVIAQEQKRRGDANTVSAGWHITPVINGILITYYF